jgi:hypothetical protein
MRRTLGEYDSAMSLLVDGRSDREVACRLGIPRSTVGHWRRARKGPLHEASPDASVDWRPLSATAYSYLLGTYLGDGHVVVASARSARLVITLDTRYPGIVDEVRAAMATTFTAARVSSFLRMGGSCQALQICSPDVPRAFPQHGPGRKHLRLIELHGWQRRLTRSHPEQFLRGLIHSDGCRTINRFKTTLPSGRVAEYEYPRYFFSNLSADIRRIFCEHCDLLGIRWTQSNPRNISVSHRDSVARLDECIGPKT